MKDEKLLEFLKTYAEVLREDVDLSPLYPLKWEAIMAGGSIVLKGGPEFVRVGGICVSDEPTCPSMPIGPASTSLARLLTNLFNAYMKYTKDNIGETD